MLAEEFNGSYSDKGYVEFPVTKSYYYDRWIVCLQTFGKLDEQVDVSRNLGYAVEEYDGSLHMEHRLYIDSVRVQEKSIDQNHGRFDTL